MQKTSFLLLIIYTLFSSETFCQNLNLKVSGENEFETQIIDSLNYSKTYKDYNSLKHEIDSIQNALYKKGYIENRLNNISKTSDSIFNAEIHLKQKFNTIYIYYNKSDIDIANIDLISKQVFDDYFIISFSEIENALNFINSKVSQQGYPFSKLKLSNIKIRKDSNLEAQLIISSEEQKRNIDNIIIKGYEKFPKSYLKHYLKITKNSLFDLNEIKKKNERLDNLKFANQIKPPEVLFTKDSTTLYLYIEKAKSNSFDGFLGFGTNDETNNLEFDGYLNLSLTNNLNFGESFRLLYKSDENDQKTFNANISMPYLFNSPIGVDFSLQIFKRDSSFTTVNQIAKLHYQINSRNKIYSGVNSTTSNNLLSNTTASISDYDTTYYSLAYEFISQQSYNLLFPIKTSLYVETNFGKRTTSNISEKQTHLFIDAFKIINFNNRNSFYIRVNSSTLNSDSYFENELLRFGGINSIRGFEENSLYASLFGVINTEYRFQLSNSIYIHTITDLAYFENEVIKSKEKLFGYGFGFGLLTKAGLLKFNYANGKAENQPFKLSNSKIHISLVANF
ncbi:POTRA domain-containing protein [uncultured Algibacter sp.]|uniref:POTRA domain-containing protein n=1 Tax=uncultured Algibacter sp. TaxID=298659 RepID=UPI002620F7B0|nr:POTRA domain-containing protein [uncultured Algibacter sp.]